ncbi:MAG: phenylacetate--CoA ligase family protein, partial [bacterium]
NCYENSSGGSTGEPVRLIQDRYYRDWVLAIKMLDDLWGGYLSGEKKMLLWGSERDLLVDRETLKFRLSKWLRNEIWLNAFRMTSDKMRGYIKQINTFRPLQILAYAESIYELARFIDRDGLKLDYRPQAIMTSAGTMDSHKREIIERVFRVPVFNRYGSREVGDIACECESHKGLHVHAPTHYVEILRPDGSPTEPGETGEIVVTSLINHVMPLIRYRIGDMGAWSEKACVCGRSWPLLKEVTGRTSDYFILKNGDRFRLPTFWFIANNWIKKYQVIQEDYKLITVFIVPLRGANNPHQKYRQSLMVLKKNIKGALGHDCQVNFDFVREITPTASGKFCYTLSKVANI